MPLKKMVECRADKIRKHINSLQELAKDDAYISRMIEKVQLYDDFKNLRGTAISRFCDLSVKYKLSESRIEKIVREMAFKNP